MDWIQGDRFIDICNYVYAPEMVKDWDVSKAFGVCTDYVIV